MCSTFTVKGDSVKIEKELKSTAAEQCMLNPVHLRWETPSYKQSETNHFGGIAYFLYFCAIFYLNISLKNGK
jgi:hypothetical protein